MKYQKGDQMMRGVCSPYLVGKNWKNETTWKTRK